MDIAEALRREIDARGIKQSWLAAEAGVPEETLSRILTRTTKNPGVATLQKVARVLGRTVSELLAEAPAEHEPTPYDRHQALRRLTDELASKPAEVRDGVADRLTWISEQLSRQSRAAALAGPRDTRIRITLADEEPREMSDDELQEITEKLSNVIQFRKGRRWQSRDVPLVGEVSAGHGIEIHEEYEKLRQIPDFYWNAGARAAVKAVGVSMWDMGITPNDLLYFKPQDTAQNEDVVIFSLNGKAYVKEFEFKDGRVTMHSAHPDYPPMKIEVGVDDFRIFGVVVGRSGYPPKRRQIQNAAR